MIGKLLGFVTGNLWPIAGVAFAGLLLAIGVLKLDNLRLEISVREAKALLATERGNAQAAAAQQEREFREREAATRREQQEKIDAAEQQLAQARADVVIRDAAAGRLQSRITALVAAAREAARDPQAVGEGASADDPAGMLANVLGRCIERVRLLATVADGRGIAGGLCEASYDALTAEAP